MHKEENNARAFINGLLLVLRKGDPGICLEIRSCEPRHIAPGFDKADMEDLHYALCRSVSQEEYEICAIIQACIKEHISSHPEP